MHCTNESMSVVISVLSADCVISVNDCGDGGDGGGCGVSMDMGCSCPSGAGSDVVPTHKSSSLSISVHESACEETLTHDAVSMLYSRSGSRVDDVMEVVAAGGLLSSVVHFDGGARLLVG